MLQRATVLLMSLAMVSAGGWAWAEGDCCDPCEPQVQYVEKTVYCPTWVTETRTEKVCEYRREERQREVTVYDRVPEMKTVTKTVCEMVPETRAKTCSYTVRKPGVSEQPREYEVRVPVWTEVEQEYTVMVPHEESRSATRTVCKCVPVTDTKVVTVDEGCWEKQQVEVPCQPRRRVGRRASRCGDSCGGSCGDCCTPATRTVCKPVWVPNLVEKEIECTRHERQTEEVPYEYTVTVCKPETRTRTVKVCEYQTETRSRTVKVRHYETEEKTREYTYTVCVPQTKEVEVEVTTVKCVPRTETQTYTICVPVTVEKEVEVRVCKMEPKTVQVPVCSDECNSDCCRGCRLRSQRGCGC